MDIRHTITPSRLRLLLQTAFTLFCLYTGWRFYLFVQWATGHSQTIIQRPSSVEGFLPISALLAFKRFVLTGQWDTIHPAGLTIFIAAITISLLVRKGFCGYICPVGLISRLLAAGGKHLGISWQPPHRLHKTLTACKYILLAFFVFTVLNMSVQGIDAFLRAPYNLTADARMLKFFLHPSVTFLVIIALLATLGMIIPYFWCRYLCPYGALLGIFSFFSPLAVVRDPDSCLHCSKCSKSCPGGIDVQTKLRIHSPECIGCMQCVDVCPAKSCLGPRLPFIGRIHPFLPAFITVAIFLSFYLWAFFTGHWDNTMSAAMLRRFYAMHLIGM